MNILIRTYGSHLMGMGHLYRMIKLVQMLKNKIECNITLLTREYEESKLIYGQIDADEIVKVQPEISINEEVKLVDSFDNFDICINDQLNTEYEIAKILKFKSKRRITFDDRGEGNVLFDKIINILYPSCTPLKQEVNDYSYMILRGEESLKKSISFNNKVTSIFINQGAADTWGAIPDLINDLNRLELHFTIKVLLGPSFKHYDELSSVLKNNKKKIVIYNYVDNIIELVKNCDLAIVGAGNTLFEIASIGIPIIASTREEKELITINKLVKENIVFSTSKLYTDNISQLIKSVILDTESRKEKFYLTRNLFQYDGLNKIINEFILYDFFDKGLTQRS